MFATVLWGCFRAGLGQRAEQMTDQKHSRVKAREDSSRDTAQSIFPKMIDSISKLNANIDVCMNANIQRIKYVADEYSHKLSLSSLAFNNLFKGIENSMR